MTIFEYTDTNPWTQTEDARQAGYEGPGWYFWDETQAHCHGPHESREAAGEAQLRYAKEFLGP